MSSWLASLVVLLLNALVVAPLAVAARARRTPKWLVAGYSALLLAIAAYQLGFTQRRPVPPIDAANLSGASFSTSQCAEILSLLEDGGVIVDRRRPPRLVVAQQPWTQLPEEAREIVIVCVRQGWPRGAGTPQLEVR